MQATSKDTKDLFMQELDQISKERNVDKKHAFLIWICENVLKISDSSDIDEAISICGEHNCGVDIFYIEEHGDEIDQYVCWSQVKFADDLDLEITAEDIESFTATIDALENPPSNANPIFKQKAQDFEDVGKTEARIRKRMLFAASGVLTPQAQNLCNNHDWRLLNIENIHGPPIEFKVLDLHEILSYITIPPTSMLRIKFEGGNLTRTDDVTQKRSIVGYVRAQDVANISKKHRSTMFLENPRESLGGTSTNKAIQNTLINDDQKKKFWKLNNGITAICDSFTKAHDENDAYDISNFKIVNGRQTTFTLEKFSAHLNGVSLFMVIHEAVDDQERALISEATNTQNAIKEVDLITNSPELIDLELHCRHNFPNFYFERQTKGFKAENSSLRRQVTKRRVLDKSLVARSYYAYAIDPNGAMKSEKEFFAINSKFYNDVFKNRHIRDLIIPHIFMDMIKSLQAKWQVDNERSRDWAIISKRNVKYYLLRLIHESLANINDPKKIKNVEDKLIDHFQCLSKNETPEVFYDVAKAAYYDFMLNFDQLRNETWPEDILKAINDDKSNTSIPSPVDIMYQLKKRGEKILPVLLANRRYNHALTSDLIKDKLLTLI